MRRPMSGRPRTVILTGNAARHRFAASALARGTELVGILREEKRAAASQSALADSADRACIESHLAGLGEAEREAFGDVELPSDAALREVPNGATHEPECFEWVRDLAPDAVVLFGTSIIRPPLLSHYEGRIINCHLGLSPYYRGTATNFWPLVHGEPECVGATIHLAIQKVDAGAILAQIRPTPAPDDDVHRLGMRVIRAAWEAMPAVIDAYLTGRCKPVTQPKGTGRVFRRNDFDAESVRAMRRHFEAGMISEYLADLERRQAARPIIELVTS